MDALDQLVAQVQALSGSEQDVVHLSSMLKQADDLLHAHALRLGYALTALDPAKHSLGYLYLLFVSDPFVSVLVELGFVELSSPDRVCVANWSKFGGTEFGAVEVTDSLD